MINRVKYFIKLYIFKKKWIKENRHNKTTVAGIFPIEKVKVKKGTYGRLNVKVYNATDPGLFIGNYCSIADEVKFLLGGGHPYKRISTYPFKPMLFNGIDEAESKGPIIIDDDVWIGYGCTILSGVHICQGAVIAAGSIVYKDVPAYAIFSNGKILKYRFSNQIIEKLLSFNYDNINEKIIEKNIDLFYSDINGENDLEKFIEILNEK